MTDSNSAIDQQAAEWVVRLHSDQRTRADEDGFRAWLEQDTAHAEAYADCAALWDGVTNAIDTDEAHEILMPLRGSAGKPGRFNRRSVLLGGLAAAAVAALVSPLMALGEHSFQTKPGEQKRVRLADGSGVLLNTDSKLRVIFVADERRLFLDRGQAFFQVAKDPTRPFRVFVGSDEVRALGTAFEVRRIGDAALVTLEEGQVAIYRASGAETSWTAPIVTPSKGSESRLAALPAPAAVLSPGNQVELDAAKPLEVRQVDLKKIQAWRYGRMILDGAPLAETVADLNRYGGVQIVLADPKLANLRVSGVFHTGRPDDFVEAVTTAFPVRIARQDEYTIVLQRR